MALPEPQCRVRLTEDAVSDLHRLQRKDPQIVRDVFKKMLLLERATDAGEPLLGALIGFRKLVVGNRDYRIVWRQTTDDAYEPVLEVAEIWAAGARSDSEIYEEMKLRATKLNEMEQPEARALASVVREMGRLYAEVDAHPEPPVTHHLPFWLVQALQENLHLDPGQISELSQEEAQQRLAEHWAKPPPGPHG